MELLSFYRVRAAAAHRPPCFIFPAIFIFLTRDNFPLLFRPSTRRVSNLPLCRRFLQACRTGPSRREQGRPLLLLQSSCLLARCTITCCRFSACTIRWSMVREEMPFWHSFVKLIIAPLPGELTLQGLRPHRLRPRSST